MADVLAWPELPTGVCAALKQWYRSPLQQQAAFDDVAGAFELLEFCHLGLDPVALVSCATFLVDWQQSSQARFKQARASAVLDMRERLTLETNGYAGDPCTERARARVLHLVSLTWLRARLAGRLMVEQELLFNWLGHGRCDAFE